MVCSCLGLSFHVTYAFQSTVGWKFEAKFSCQPRSSFRGGRVLRVRPLFFRRSALYQRKHIRCCELVVSVQSDKSPEDEGLVSFHWTEIFVTDSKKIDEKFRNVFLNDLPDLRADCSKTEISALLGKTIKVGNEELSTRDASLNVASSLLLPKKFGEDFPLESSGGKISRVFLRQDLIDLWNGLVDERNMRKLNILSAASGLGKSIYLYLIAVFARHFGIPVQYIGNTSDLLGQEDDNRSVVRNYVGNTESMLHKRFDDKLVARKYAAMLLFMNSGILGSLGPFYSGRPRYDFLQRDAIKFVAYYAFVKGDLVLCDELRRNFMNMAPRNLLIIDEHNALWQELGNDPNTWLPFFKLYARPVAHSTWECKFVIATSQHHEFESKLPSGYRNSTRYIEPLSKEEFKIWQALDDYPETFRDNESTIVDLTGRVPRTIAELIELSRSFRNFSFEALVAWFTKNAFGDMKKRHEAYLNSLTEEKKKAFYNMLYELFLGRETPAIALFDSAYRDRGLLLEMNNGSLRFYNSIARDVLFESFSNYYFTKERLVEVSNKFKEARRKGFSSGEYFEELFLHLCQQFRPDIEVYSRRSYRTIHLKSNLWLRFDGKEFMPPRPKIEFSCWIRFGTNYPRLDYAYVDVTDDGNWMLYLIQVSVSSFPAHDTDSAQLERLFKKTGGTVQLASLLNSFFAEVLEVSPVYDAREKIVNFEVTDSQGISCRDRISILYVTPLTREDAKADSAPEFVEFLTFDNFPGHMKSYIDVGLKVRSRRSSPRRRSVKQTEAEGA
ncbi:hypothetical protein GAYE_SCF09G3265 [Galdieria yellowstonensis]|uniref:Uncharacterized protein n=1 Tax=Galdieria yellowstonensis TaxID=3028027 RepID=A0AAV9ID49_9RHOD|nr:hypothetical protein GAYE_SCF09G3265 [Galdieria yellowstonensis]